MQKLTLNQSLQQKLSPQQIQFIKLLQIPSIELETRILEEIEVNPALEEGSDEFGASSSEPEQDDFQDDYQEDIGNVAEEVSLSDYVSADDVQGYKMQADGNVDEEERESPLANSISMTDNLLDQLGFLNLEETEYKVGLQLVGSIDADGYIRRDIESIVNDLAFLQNVRTNYDAVEHVLKKIQQFDPPGIGARDLQECLYLQLERKSEENRPEVYFAKKMLLLCFEEFKKKHFDKIKKKIGADDDAMKKAFELVLKLNPKPGGTGSNTTVRTQYLVPDFILKELDGKIEISLNSKNAPDLRVSRSYADMLDAYDKSNKKDKKLKQEATFVKQKLDSAKWFIDAIKQRQQTLLKTMKAILDHQIEYFMSGDEGRLKPMILKDIAEVIHMDISTVSRVANSKSVQTEYGVFLLKYFFSESIATEDGGDVSSKEVKHVLKSMIEEEDKRKPLSDEKLEKMLKEKGYNIARRTVAKYREQLHIPVARLRKQL